MENIESISDLINKGGFFIYPLLLCSIFAVTIFLQKLWQLRTENIIPSNFTSQFLTILKTKNIEDIRSFCDMNDSSISKIALTAINNRGKSNDAIREEIEAVGISEAKFLGKYIEGFGAISNVSTLLGLLGTIAGMIKIFGVISQKDIVNPPALAGGISEALYTTAFGLSIAIPTFIAYKYIKGRHEELVTRLEDESKKILEIFSPRQ